MYNIDTRYVAFAQLVDGRQSQDATLFQHNFKTRGRSTNRMHSGNRITNRPSASPSQFYADDYSTPRLACHRRPAETPRCRSRTHQRPRRPASLLALPDAPLHRTAPAGRRMEHPHTGTYPISRTLKQRRGCVEIKFFMTQPQSISKIPHLFVPLQLQTNKENGNV